MRLYLTEKMDKRRLGRRRFLFFSTIFAFTSVATWFMADLLWRGGLSGVELALLLLFAFRFQILSDDSRSNPKHRHAWQAPCTWAGI